MPEWHAAWTQWAFGAPADQNPLLDTPGQFTAVDQSGPVWFLAGSLGGTIQRTCTIPAGKGLLAPLLNSFWIGFCTDPPVSADCAANNYECLRDMIRLADGSEARCEIDGVLLSNIQAYRAESTVFSINTTLDSLLAVAFGAPVCLNGPCVDDGYYVMLTPLTPGQHSIRLYGRIPNGLGPGVDFITDVTYNLTVR